MFHRFLTTRETFPGETSFADLCRAFFGDAGADERATFIADAWQMSGLLVHMANPEQLDDLLSHIDRKGKVRFLSTSYIHADLHPYVYAIGRGTGFLIDGGAVRIDHVSLKDSNTVTAPGEQLVVEDHAKVADLAALHDTLKHRDEKEWNEVNVSFEGADCIRGIFSLDGVMSKLYAAILARKSGGLLPVFTYNRERNELARFTPTEEHLEELIAQLPSPELRGRYQGLVG